MEYSDLQEYIYKKVLIFNTGLATTKRLRFYISKLLRVFSHHIVIYTVRCNYQKITKFAMIHWSRMIAPLPKFCPQGFKDRMADMKRDRTIKRIPRPPLSNFSTTPQTQEHQAAAYKEQ